VTGQAAEPGRGRRELEGGGGRVREVVRVEVGRKVVAVIDARKVVQEGLLDKRSSEAVTGESKGDRSKRDFQSPERESCASL
jgi:hypothetical protein